MSWSLTMGWSCYFQQFPKNCRKLASTRFDNFTSNCNFLFHNQHGFQNNHYTSLAVTELIAKHLPLWTTKNYRSAFRLTYQKLLTPFIIIFFPWLWCSSFDHNILITELKYYWIREITLFYQIFPVNTPLASTLAIHVRQNWENI